MPATGIPSTGVSVAGIPATEPLDTSFNGSRIVHCSLATVAILAHAADVSASRAASRRPTCGPCGLPSRRAVISRRPILSL